VTIHLNRISMRKTKVLERMRRWKGGCLSVVADALLSL